jgi:hypothetical protein
MDGDRTRTTKPRLSICPPLHEGARDEFGSPETQSSADSIDASGDRWLACFAIDVVGAAIHPRVYDRLRTVLDGRFPGVSDFPSGFDISCRVYGQEVEEAMSDSCAVVSTVLGTLALSEEALVYHHTYDDQNGQIIVHKNFPPESI